MGYDSREQKINTKIKKMRIPNPAFRMPKQLSQRQASQRQESLKASAASTTI